MNVWCAFLRNKVTILRHEDVEVWPTAITSLIHIVAGHKHLWREHRWLLSILELNTSLHDLGHGDGVAGTAFTLISEVTSEVISIDVSVVQTLWDLAIRNILRVLVHFLILSGFFKYGLEFFVILGTKFFFWRLISDYLVQVLPIVIISLAGLKKKCFLIAVLSIVWMVLLILANISLPAQVCCVDRGNQNIHLVRWLMF